jgi:hypothetical protein
MQLTLSFLQASPPPKEPNNLNLGPATRAEAVRGLARMIVQASEVSKRKETTNE